MGIGSGRSSTAEYELCLQARADQWSNLFWSTIRDLHETLSSDFPAGVPSPLKSISVPVSEFRIQTQEELNMICSAIRLELKRFARDQKLAQGLLLTYSPMTMMGNSIRAEMCVGKKAVEELKQRMADLALDQMLPVNLENHLVILKDCVPTQSGHGRLQTESNKKHFMGALCIS